MRWLRSTEVLLPGVTTLAQLVARVRDETTDGLCRALEALPTPRPAAGLDRLVVVPDGSRSRTWSGGAGVRLAARPEPGKGAGPGRRDQRPRDRPAGPGRARPAPPGGRTGPVRDDGPRQAIRRHPNQRRLATLLATDAYLEARSVDDCLELLDLLMVAELLNKAESAKGKVGRDGIRALQGLGSAGRRGGGAVRGIRARRGADPGRSVGVDRGGRAAPPAARLGPRDLGHGPPAGAGEDAELRARLTGGSPR